MTPAQTASAQDVRTPPNVHHVQRSRLIARARLDAWTRHREAMTRLILAKVDWVPVLIFASILMTPEARIDLGGFQLYPYRLALIASLPAMLIRVAREPIRFGILDLCILGSALSMFVSTALHYEIGVALKTGGSNTMDMMLSYMAGRIFFRSALDLRRFLYRITPLVVATAVLMAAESVTHTYLLRPFVGAITGKSPAVALANIYEIRVGFLRAIGPFLHPIAAGLFLGSLVPLFIAADLPKRRWLGLFGCFGGIFGWSSAGLVAIFSGIAFGTYDHLQKRLRLGWAPFLWAILIGCAVIQVFSEGGLITSIIRYGALNPQTGYFRLLIWEYGSASVAKSPWIGIGYFESYERPDWMRTSSVDNYWLLHSLRYGVPSMLLMFVGVFGNVIKLAGSNQGPELGALRNKRMATGVCITIGLVYTFLLTSAPWGADMAWLIMLVGLAAGLADQRTRSGNARVVGQLQPRLRPGMSVAS
jgi:hypothetical protein